MRHEKNENTAHTVHCVSALLAALSFAEIFRIKQQGPEDLDLEYFEEIYRVTSPDLSTEEENAEKEIIKWLEQNADFSKELTADFANVFVRCSRFDHSSETACILSMRVKEQTEFWIIYSVKAGSGAEYDISVPDSKAAKEVKYVYQDNSLLYAASIP